MSDERLTFDTLSDNYDSKNFDSYFQNERSEMLSYIPGTALKILDVGCADGSFGKVLKTRNSAEVWGIEPNPTAAAIASQKLDKVISSAFSSDLNLPIHKFDCIIFNDVLEHMVDPNHALLYAKELLSQDGVIVASIPNVRYFDNIWNLLIHKNWEYSNWGILDRTHLRFFTYRSIAFTFESLGYTIESLAGINPCEKVHPHQTNRFKFLNRLFLNKIEDMRYLQFAIVAHPKLD